MRLLRRLRYLWRQGREARDLADEIEFHRAMAEQAQQAAGLTKGESEAAARRVMGNTVLASEDARHVWIAGWIESFWQDVRYAARSLAGQPSFTAMALLALILGIGLNTSLFTAINSVFSRTWDVPEPERVMELAAINPKNGRPFGFSVAMARYLNMTSQTREGVTTGRAYGMSLDGLAPSSSSNADFVSGNFFDVLHVPLTMGRGFRPEEDVAGAPVPVAVINPRLWREHFRETPDILGRVLHIDGVPFTVIGVAAESFGGTYESRTDVWAPLASLPLARSDDPSARTLLTDPDRCCVGASARLRARISREQAASELTALASNYALDLKRDALEVRLNGTAMLDNPERRRRIAPVLAIVITAFGSILLLACANVSNLMLARAASRQREFAIRVAIGAGRRRVIRQLLTESLFLAGIASAAALLIAYWLPSLVLRFIGQTPPSNLHLTPDENVVIYSAGIALVSALAFGLAPALRGTRIAVSEAMKHQGAHSSARNPMRGALLGVQVAISAALLMAGGLLVRGLEQARSIDLGFRTEGITAIRLTLPPNTYNLSKQAELYNDLMSKLEAGGAPAALSLRIPLGETSEYTDFGGVPCTQRLPIETHRVSARYFDVLRIPILQGRGFMAGEESRLPIVVNETLARLCWPDRSPIGQTVSIGNRPHEVIGVARDAQVSRIGRRGPIYFAPLVPDGDLVRGSISVLLPSPVVRPAMASLREIDPRIAAEAILLRDQVDRALGDTAGIARIAAALGLVALLLATVGVYGVISYSVEQRRREIGVRMALGARANQVVALVLRQNARALAIGLAAGLLIGVGESVILKSELYGLSPADPFAYGGVLAILVISGIAASIVPARRTAAVDPVETLRAQ